MLEAHDSVVRVAHDDHVAGGASLPPLVDPSIIDMMEVNVCQERADDRALRRPLLGLDHASIFEHACRQPFGNQSDDLAVANPMLDETDQPILADFVEKGLNVTIEHPVDPPPPDPNASASNACPRRQVALSPILVSRLQVASPVKGASDEYSNAARPAQSAHRH